MERSMILLQIQLRNKIPRKNLTNKNVENFYPLENATSIIDNGYVYRVSIDWIAPLRGAIQSIETMSTQIQRRRGLV